MLESFFKYPKVLGRLRQGPLVDDIDWVAGELARKRYARLSSVRYLSLIATFSRYAEAHGFIDPKKIDCVLAERFLAQLTVSPSLRRQARTALGHLFRHLQLRYPSADNSTTTPDSDAQLLSQFDTYLDEVRGLQARTREGTLHHARQILRWYRKNRPGRGLSELDAQDVLDLTAFLTSGDSAYATRSAAVSHLRSILRYLRWEGMVREDFARLVPRTPCWRLAEIPDHLGWEQIRQVIDAVDTANPIGMRDRAMLLLLATTGMRSGELRRLQLRDIGWQRGEIRLPTTKNRRERIVPLLEEAGSALADYVLHGRPAIAETTVFLCHRPPVRPIGSSTTVSRIVQRRLAHCDIHRRRAGAHLFRHSLATRMIQQDRPVKEVADLLGHHRIDVTAVYIKVALPQLADVALPFPGGAS